MKPKHGERVNWIAIGGLVALGLVTLALIFLALKTGRAAVPNAGETPGYQPGSIVEVESPSTDKDTVDTEQVTDEDPGTSGAAVVPALTRILSVQDANVGYRAVTGPCPETQAVIENTADGGGSWTSVDLSVYGAVSSPARILSGTDGYVTLAAQNGDDCASMRVMQSYSYGAEWDTVIDGSAITWHISPTDPTVVNVPGVGGVQAPCEAARLTTSSATSASVLCVDTRVATTTDSGANWAVSQAFPGAESITSSGASLLLAQSGAAECEGTLVSLLSAGHSVSSFTCVPGAAPGQTAIAAATDGTAWLWAGDTLAKSADGGVTWG